jgi:hypothetical protein
MATLELGDGAGYCVQTLEPSHIAGQWRKLSPSAEDGRPWARREVYDQGYWGARRRPLTLDRHPVRRA